MSMTQEEFQQACQEADRRMKESNGHNYMTILKTRCMNCGRSPKVTTRCSGWLNTYMDRLAHVLQEKGVING